MIGQLLTLALTTTLLVGPLGSAVAVADPGPDVTTATTAPAPAPTVGEGTTPEPVQDPATAATRALAGAQDLFAPTTSAPQSRADRPATQPTRDGTLVLRELALRAHDLATPAERRSARHILRRPTDGSNAVGGEPKYTVPAAMVCTATVCVHWVENDANAPTGSDGDPATVPSWVSLTLQTVDAVYTAETAVMGYRTPVPDTAAIDNGGDGRLDVYLANIGDQGLYGYCVPDDTARTSVRAVYGYCVLDNDYAATEFGGTRTPVDNLRVTAAHELFHAVQFAYDWSEDPWLMEGTATWMEDQLFDAVDDNRRYLAGSPLAASDMPLDFATADLRGYGAWLFWRFLSESSGPGNTDDPTMIRYVWEQAAGDAYSLQALQRVLALKGTTIAETLARFGVWNRDPAHYYSEGHAYHASPLLASRTLSRRSPTSHPHTATLYHLGQLFVRYVPSPSLGRHATLRVAVDMPATYRGSLARVIVHHRNGRVVGYPVRLTRSGAGTRLVGFSSHEVSSVELDLINASTRYRCHQNTYESCSGLPLDDALTTRYAAHASR
ncbi:hypothetical protein KRR39_05310 [Nocardioides panacis]|uniref:Uncharacterized protein n=1 Tax=Nocardioides panacis TaxID=2849501 RepID=A0A975T0F4_9ACTN|nr:MXAN_6640 family putative metalloprotease [Nocardioides panacis]QWZ09211.1 hypothetical protein KRR39_05310 [Nocardioides panacis]